MVVQSEITLRLPPRTRLLPRVLARPQCISKLNDYNIRNVFLIRLFSILRLPNDGFLFRYLQKLSFL